MYKIVVIGASAGGVDALSKLMAGLPADFAACVCVAMHIGARRSALPAILARHCALPVHHARHEEALRPGVVLIAPPDRHLLLESADTGGCAMLAYAAKENHTRPAIDPLFRSAAAAFGCRVIGVILTGYLGDGTLGLRAIKTCGGIAIVQDPADAYAPDMPARALASVTVDLRLALRDIPEAPSRLAVNPPSATPPGGPPNAAGPQAQAAGDTKAAGAHLALASQAQTDTINMWQRLALTRLTAS